MGHIGPPESTLMCRERARLRCVCARRARACACATACVGRPGQRKGENAFGAVQGTVAGRSFGIWRCRRRATTGGRGRATYSFGQTRYGFFS